MAKKEKVDLNLLRSTMGPEDSIAEAQSLAMNLAKKQLREGTAKAQVISFFLDLGTKKSELELQILEEKKALLQAQTKSLTEQGDTKAILEEALKAFRKYAGGES